MPYDYDPNLDEDEDPSKKAQSSDPTADNTSLAGGSQVVGGLSQTTPTADANSSSSTPQGTSSGQFQNLNDYLNANAGSGFGGEFAGKVQNTVDQAGQAQTDASNNFKTAADQATTKYNADLVNQATSDPYTFTQDPNNVTAFNAQRDATYKGPSTLQDTPQFYSQAAGATQNALDATQAAQSEGGRFALLNNYFGTPDYNQGQKSLDNLLISGDAGAQTGISAATQAAQQARQNLDTQGTSLANYAAADRGTTEQANAQTRAALGIDANGNLLTDGSGAIGTAQTALNNQLTQRQADLTAQNAAYQANGNATTASGLGSTYGSDYQGQSLLGGTQFAGVDPYSGIGQDYLYGVKAGNYVNYADPSALTTSNIADTATQQKMAALGNLAGLSNPLLDQSNLGQYASSSPTVFNSSAFDNAVAQAAGNYQSGVNGLGGTTPNAGGLTSAQTEQANETRINQLNALRATYGLPPVPVSNPNAPVIRTAF